jgi:hypothetical protein
MNSLEIETSIDAETNPTSKSFWLPKRARGRRRDPFREDNDEGIMLVCCCVRGLIWTSQLRARVKLRLFLFEWTMPMLNVDQVLCCEASLGQSGGQ